METDASHLPALQFQSPNDFFSKIEKVIYIDNPLNELAISPSAIVYYGSPPCTLKCFCPMKCIKCDCDCSDYYRYNTLTVNGGVQKYLFKNIVKLDCDICGCTGLINRFAYCKSFSINSFDQYSSDAGVETVETTKENNCICCDICPYYLDVRTKPNNNLVGIVKFGGECCRKTKKCCDCKDMCYDCFYWCDILSPNKELVYTIFLKKCCITCYPVGCCDESTLVIKLPDGTTVGEIVGKRNCCNCCGICGSNFTYIISFPLDASPEMKLTIINAVIVCDAFTT